MISLRDIEFRYASGEFSLHVSTLDVANGEKVAVIGPSGSGKSTLLNLIAGISVPQRGAVVVDDATINELDDAARRRFRITVVGFVFQDFELLDYLDVLDNVLHCYRISEALQLTREVRARARTLAGRMGIEDKLRRRPRDLSQGEKQRAAICRALLAQPRLILADEATGNLDPANKHLILDALFASARQENATLLAVTHDHELLPRFDRVIDFSSFASARAA